METIPLSEIESWVVLRAKKAALMRSQFSCRARRENELVGAMIRYQVMAIVLREQYAIKIRIEVEVKIASLARSETKLAREV